MVSPCGMYCELVSDYAPEARVVIPGKDGEEIALVLDLIPNEYQK